MIGATRVWVVGEILTAANMNTFLSTLIEDLAGRNGAILLEGPLEVVGGASGYFRAPSLTTVQRDALTPVDGFQVYNSTDNQMQFRENGAWVAIGSHAATHAGGAADDIGGQAMIWTVDQVWNDNIGIVLGTNDPGRTRIFHDGTDLFFDNFVGASASAVMMALADGFPSPDGTAVHIWRGTAGVVTAGSDAALVIEDNGELALQFLAPNANASLIFFGSLASNVRGVFGYHGSADTPADTFTWRTAGNVERLRYSSGAFAFQESTTISTTAGDIILNPAGDLNTNTRLVFTAGKTVTAGAYVIQRDTSPTNDLIINVPTGAQISLRINDIDELLVDPDTVDIQDNNLVTTGEVQAALYKTGLITVYKASGETVAGTTLQDDDDLVFAAGTNETWLGHILLIYAAAEAGDIACRLTGPTGSVITLGQIGMDIGSTSINGEGRWEGLSEQAVTTGIVVNGGEDSSDVTLLLPFSAKLGGTAGNIQLQWSKNGAGGGSTTVRPGSYLFAMRVS